MTNLRQRMVEELQRRNYSPATIRGYVLAVKQFAEYFGKPPDRLGATQVQRFQWYLLQERKLTPGNPLEGSRVIRQLRSLTSRKPTSGVLLQTYCSVAI